jgi:hypothetical protein
MEMPGIRAAERELRDREKYADLWRRLYRQVLEKQLKEASENEDEVTFVPNSITEVRFTVYCAIMGS